MRPSLLVGSWVALMAAAVLPRRSLAKVDPVQFHLGGQKDDFTEKYGSPVGAADVPFDDHVTM